MEWVYAADLWFVRWSYILSPFLTGSFGKLAFQKGGKNFISTFCATP